MKSTVTELLPYKIKDITLADFGRKEIEIAEKELANGEYLTHEDIWSDLD